MTNDTLIHEEALYMLTHKATVRQTGKHFNRSKTTVHNDMREKLPYIDGKLAVEVAKLLNFNLKARSQRGGESTRIKWKRIKGDVNRNEKV